MQYGGLVRAASAGVPRRDECLIFRKHFLLIFHETVAPNCVVVVVAIFGCVFANTATAVDILSQTDAQLSTAAIVSWLHTRFRCIDGFVQIYEIVMRESREYNYYVLEQLVL